MKKSMKRIGALLIALTVCVSCLFAGGLFASAEEPDTELSLTSPNISATDDTVEIKINLDKNPGLVTFSVRVQAPNGFKLTKKVFSGFGTDMSKPVSATPDNPYPLVWGDDLASENCTTTGTVFTLTYAVDHSVVVAGGTYTFELIDFGASAFLDFDLNDHYATYKTGTVTVAACQHTYGNWIIDHDANCTEPGLKYRVCSKCTAHDEEVIPAKGHVDGEWVEVTKHTCTDDGEEVLYCAECGEELNRRTVPAGHVEGEWVEETKHTCTEDGEEVQHCAECGEELARRPVPAAHTPGEWVVKKAATANEKGLEAHVCAECGEEYETRDIPIPPTGDNMNLALAVFALAIAFGGMTVLLAKKADTRA